MYINYKQWIIDIIYIIDKYKDIKKNGEDKKNSGGFLASTHLAASILFTRCRNR